MDAVSLLVATLLREAPALSIVVTSQRRLGIAGDASDDALALWQEIWTGCRSRSA